MRAMLYASCILALLSLTASGERADDQAEAKSLVQKLIEAHGGDKLLEVKAATVKSKITAPDGRVFLSTVSVQPPHQFRAVIEEKGGKGEKTIHAMNGGVCMCQENGQEVKLDEEGRKKIAHLGHRLNLSVLLSSLKNESYKLKPLGESKVGEDTVEGVKVIRPGHRDIDLFFDKSSHRLVKLKTTTKISKNGEEVPLEAFYSDYKEVQGCMVPMKVKYKRNDRTGRTVEILEYKLHNEKLPEEHFAKPAK